MGAETKSNFTFFFIAFCIVRAMRTSMHKDMGNVDMNITNEKSLEISITLSKTSINIIMFYLEEGSDLLRKSTQSATPGQN